MIDKQITIALIGVFGAIITMILKSVLDRLAAKRDLNKRDKNFSDRLGAIENIVTKLDMKIGNHLSDDNFRNNLKNVLRMRISTIVNIGRFNPAHRNILFYFGQIVEDFCFFYYYSDFRKTEKEGKKDLVTYLTDEFESKRASLHKFVDENLPERKGFSKDIRSSKLFNKLENVHKFNTINFYDLLMLSRTLSISYLMIERLIRNGFDGNNGKNELIKVFSNYIDDFTIIYQDTMQLWETLPKIDEND